MTATNRATPATTSASEARHRRTVRGSGGASNVPKSRSRISMKSDRSMSPSDRLSTRDMLSELADYNAFFDMVVDMIPSKLYIAGQSGDDYNPKYKKIPKKDSRETRRAEAKAAKRRKLDPSLAETTVQIKERLEQQQDARAVPVPSAKTPTKAAPSSPAVYLSPHQSRIEALREKLHAKIAAKAGQRPPPDQVSKRAARRAAKEARKKEAQKRASASSCHVDARSHPSTSYRIDATATPAGSRGSVASDLRNMDFGQIAGWNRNNETMGASNYLESNKALKNLSKPKNIKKLLEDAEKKRVKLEQLRKGSEQEQAKAQAMLWKDTLAEADGTRIKDDPQKLKKQLKRKLAKKNKSAKAWKARLEGTREAAQERQAIRTHNLSQRKLGGKVGANLSKKQIKTIDAVAGAPGKVRPEEDSGRKLSRAGFEGRKHEFLNSGGGKEGGKNKGKE